MLNKTEARILAFLVTELDQSYSIRFISQKIKKSYRIVYETTQKLVKKGLLLEKKHGKIKTYKINIHADSKQLAYAEQFKADQYLKKHKATRIMLEGLKNKIKLPYYTLVLFGSYAENKYTKKSDIDILVILPSKDMIEKTEKVINHYAETYNYPIHGLVVNYESFLEMLKEKKLNVANEVLKKHIIFEGAENYYKIIQEVL